jgi:hypothetical protein
VRPNRMRFGAITVWLGVIALGLDALVPIHLAFDFAHTFETGAHREDTRSVDNDFARRLLTLITGHHDEDAPSDSGAGGHGKHHHPDCAVCSSLGTLAGFVLSLLPVFRCRFRLASRLRSYSQRSPASSLPHPRPPTTPALPHRYG